MKPMEEKKPCECLIGFLREILGYGEIYFFPCKVCGRELGEVYEEIKKRGVRLIPPQKEPST